MNILVSGSSGLVGTALLHALRLGQHSVRRLVRADASGRDVTWDIPSGYIDERGLQDVDAVVHLAGEGIANRRWSAEQKRRILSSRVDGTHLLAQTLASLDRKPSVLVSASAIGFYGERGDEELTEDSPPGDGFLADVCRQWEGATAPAEQAGIRVVHVRSGIVLSERGGALHKQLPLFRLGLGGRLGSGRQYTSWIAIEDEIGAILHCVETEALSGAVNATAPNPVTNAELTVALGKAVRRPAILPVPKLALNLALGGELAANLLASQRVLPAKLQATGYRFRFPDLDSALQSLLAR